MQEWSEINLHNSTETQLTANIEPTDLRLNPDYQLYYNTGLREETQWARTEARPAFPETHTEREREMNCTRSGTCS